MHGRAIAWHTTSVPIITMAVILSGCQSYEAEPLDLESHVATIDERISDAAGIQALLDRLERAGAVVPDAFDPDDGLTAAEGEVLALFANPSLRLARLDVETADAAADHADRWADPVFGFDGADILDGGTELGVTVGFSIPISGRLDVARDRAEAAVGTARSRVAAAEWAMRCAVRRAWSDWSAAEEIVALERRLLERREAASRTGASLEQSGELGRLESRVLQAERASQRLAVDSAAFEARQRRRALLALLGLGPATPVELIPRLDVPSPVVPTDADETWWQGQPQVAVLRARYAEAEEDLRLEIRRQYPDLEIAPGFGREEGSDRVLLGFSLPIPLWNANRGPIAEARARRVRARADVEATVERLRHELAAARDAERTADEAVVRHAQSILPLVTAQDEDALALAALGELDVLMLADIARRSAEESRRQIELRRARSVARIELAQLVGPPAIPREGITPPRILAPRAVPTDEPTNEPATEGDRS